MSSTRRRAFLFVACIVGQSITGCGSNVSSVDFGPTGGRGPDSGTGGGSMGAAGSSSGGFGTGNGGTGATGSGGVANGDAMPEVSTGGSLGSGGTLVDASTGGSAGAGPDASSGGTAGSAGADSGTGTGGVSSGGSAGAGGASGGCQMDPDCANGGLCVAGQCVTCANDNQCITGYGAGFICVGGSCLVGNCATDSACASGQICGLTMTNQCAPCGTDVECQSDPTYGKTTICVSGACVSGNCHADGDCPNGGICGLVTANVCAPCGATANCTAAAGYGSGYVCAAGSCVKGNCTNDAGCGAGQICGLVTANVCAPCGADVDCHGDPTYGAKTICVGGACTVGNCHGDADCATGQICTAHACGGCTSSAQCQADVTYGPGDICVSKLCKPGNCLTSLDCGGQICGSTAQNFCGACASDNACVSDGAYGAGFICVGGDCVKGNCHADTDCPTGEICGVQKANTCGPCAADADCQNDTHFGKGFICNTTTGACVDAACKPNASTCTANAADFCCNQACVPGNCCTTADCGQKNVACVSNVCTPCGPVTDDTYFVDPVNGSDAVGTGNDSTPGCAFKTITRALGAIGANPAAGTQVLVVPSGPVGQASGESFPIVVPTNVTIGGSGAMATVLVPASGTGFTLNHAVSALTRLLIDGQNHQGTTGISVTTGSAPTTVISNLTVQNMESDGIGVINQGSLQIGQGVTSTGNGIVPSNGNAGAPADGLHISNQGKVSIDVTTGAAVHFDANSEHGIHVTNAGSVTITGTPGVGGIGSITANSNGAAGLWIEQLAAIVGGGGVPLNSVTGLVAWANSGNGIRVVAGSALTLRESYVLANQQNGVMVSTGVSGAFRINAVGRIDLGIAGANPSFGANTLQASVGQNPNLGAGVCLALDPLAKASLNAAGNIFAGPTDCSVATTTLKHNATCSNAVDYSVMSAAVTTNGIVVTSCH